MKIKKETVLKLNQIFNHLLSQKTSMGFHYKIFKNAKAIETEIKALQAINKPDDKFSEFEKKRLELCELHAKKDEDGSPLKIQDGITEQYVIEDTEAFSAEINPLKEEYNEAIKAEAARQEEFLSILQEEIEVDLVKIKESSLPDLDMYGFDLSAFFEFLLEE